MAQVSMNTRKVSTSLTDKPKKSREKCGECSKVVKSEEKAIQCELCEIWFHSSCQYVDDDQYHALEADSRKNTPILHWFCIYCNKSAVKLMSGLVKLQRQMDDIQEELAKSTSRLSKVEAGVFTPDMNGSIIKLVDDKGTDIRDGMRKDYLEMQKRRNNIIVYNLKESSDVETDGRKEYDSRALADLFYSKIGVPRSVEPKAFYRLGNREANDRGAKSRPIKVILSNEWEKQQLLNRFMDVKRGEISDVGDVHIGHDQTKWEQLEYKKLKEELIRRKQNGESDLVIRDLQIRKRVRNWSGTNA
ncbi:hypothetical protein HOLleu_08472 [Holothuria leucospilota]|uniref:PHD-type domain-containing protein n=1 Tax=Holothuria leucospilota TaxID=206669 RepID=A0A9Q1CIR0_HOLLE|nr:hypothetical protein HOLleu_08472 [Holothuria leucospilota]